VGNELRFRVRRCDYQAGAAGLDHEPEHKPHRTADRARAGPPQPRDTRPWPTPRGYGGRPGESPFQLGVARALIWAHMHDNAPMVERPLARTLQQLVALLRECGQDDHAIWLETRRLALDNSQFSPAEQAAVLRELHACVTGMGGLLDLRLIPRASSTITEASASATRDELADALYSSTA
jgi:hypothetical protein